MSTWLDPSLSEPLCRRSPALMKELYLTDSVATSQKKPKNVFFWLLGPGMNHESEVLGVEGEGSSSCAYFSFLRAGCLRMGMKEFSPLLHFPAFLLGHSWSPRSPRHHRECGTSRRPGTPCEYATVTSHDDCPAIPLVHLCVYIYLCWSKVFI